MPAWMKYPVIFEINTWVWLHDLSRKYGARIDLASVPREIWDSIASLGIDAIWFMGVWERSPAGISISMQNRGNLADFHRALPDFSPQDNVGSPYCVHRYRVDEHLGGPKGLAEARRSLAQRGIRLILDFVPNHIASDHPWVQEHPEYFIQGDSNDLSGDPGSFFQSGDHIFACGRDPYFPAWQDVLQLNAFNPGLRHAALETVLQIAGQCDGMRCDMAMLLMNGVFERTWAGRAGERPVEEYWRTIIPAVHLKHPDALFIAEAYWDLEWELQQQGFDYCYDKRLYDRLLHENAENIRLHLCADTVYQGKLIRFIENHDEPRAASAFLPLKARVAALIVASLPGARLFHEGQFEGRKVRLPVFLRRRPDEQRDAALESFYRKLLRETGTRCLREGDWQLCARSGWPDNPSFQNLLAWCWRGAADRFVTVVNFSDTGAQGRVCLPWGELGGKSWQLIDLFTGTAYEREGSEMLHPGLYVDLPAWGYHFFQLHVM